MFLFSFHNNLIIFPHLINILHFVLIECLLIVMFMPLDTRITPRRRWLHTFLWRWLQCSPKSWSSCKPSMLLPKPLIPLLVPTINSPLLDRLSLLERMMLLFFFSYFNAWRAFSSIANVRRSFKPLMIRVSLNWEPLLGGTTRHTLTKVNFWYPSKIAMTVTLTITVSMSLVCLFSMKIPDSVLSTIDKYIVGLPMKIQDTVLSCNPKTLHASITHASTHTENFVKAMNLMRKSNKKPEVGREVYKNLT